MDLIIRQFPGQKHFRIEDSNEFLSGGLSLSFGVMVCMVDDFLGGQRGQGGGGYCVTDVMPWNDQLGMSMSRKKKAANTWLRSFRRCTACCRLPRDISRKVG